MSHLFHLSLLTIFHFEIAIERSKIQYSDNPEIQTVITDQLKEITKEELSTMQKLKTYNDILIY